MRHGIDEALQGAVELLHGPGCPVCVTPVSAIDAAIDFSKHENNILASFGDMLRVPGSGCSLLQARSQGANVHIVYSPLDAVQLARKTPGKQVFFFAVGFETTAPATALAILQAQQLGLTNFKVLCAHVRVQPAMEAIVQAGNSRIHGFLAAGHVCTIMGHHSYREFATRYQLPVVVTGFEPIDLLQGIAECVRQLESGECQVVNEYERSVRAGGNLAAQQYMHEVFEVRDQTWRGLGVIQRGGLALRTEWAAYDALPLNPSIVSLADKNCECPSGDVLMGRIKPTSCPHFGNRCNPQHPLGAPMVSSEGACAAYFAYSSPVRIAREEGSL